KKIKGIISMGEFLRTGKLSPSILFASLVKFTQNKTTVVTIKNLSQKVPMFFICSPHIKNTTFLDKRLIFYLILIIKLQLLNLCYHLSRKDLGNSFILGYSIFHPSFHFLKLQVQL